jgi:PAS domain S-box-containing protein
VVEPDGSLQRVAVVHTDPVKVALAYELQRRYPPDPDAPRGVYQVIRTGQAEFYPEISEAVLEAAALDEEQLDLISELGLKSAITMPILARDRVFGVITFVAAESGRRYTEADLSLTEELAGRAALAVDNARLYHEAQRLNVTLEERVKERTARLRATNQELEREIAERKRTEEELALERNLLRTLIDNLPDYIYVKDTESRFMINNLAHTRLLGATRPEELVGKTDFDTFPHELAAQYYADEQALIQSGQPLIDREQPTVDRRTGEKKWALSTKVPLRDSQGEVIGLVGLTRDITERKQVEEELRRRRQELQDHIDSMSTLSAKVALDGTLLLVNKIAQQASGLPMETLMQTNFLEGQWWAFDPEVQTRVRQAFQQACAGTSVNYEEQIFVFGQVLIISFSLVPVNGPDGRVAYIVAEARDITPLKQAEEALKARGAQLEAANKELEAFAYSVSHDLRAPLRSIDGFSQALLEDYGDSLEAEAQRYLQRVRAASQRMAELIDDLLTLSRLTRREMRLETVDLSVLAQAIVEALRQAEPARQVKFDITPQVTVKADAQLMRVALENLLGNAWKFTAKHPRACIEFGVLLQPDGQPAYLVRDDGAGFDMAYVDKLFGAFQRLHTPAEFSGTGIGLATVQRIIHRHGGHIWAEGAVDKGATFYFTL